MKKKTYIDSIHTYGRIFCLLALIVFIAIPVAISMKNGWPEMGDVLKGFGAIALLFYPTAVIEVVAYSPLLGAGGTYLSFITGNIANLKLPCALNAMENANVKSNTEEGEVITTIAIATSAIVTTIIIAVCVIAFAFNPAFENIMNSEAMQPAFKQVSLTVFGALAASYFVKYWKISIFPIAAVSLILVFAGSIDIGILIFIGAFLSIIGTHIMYKLKLV